MLESNIYFARAAANWSSKQTTQNAKETSENKERTIGTRYRTCYASFICKISGGSEINFNDLESPETPSAVMNYATHQKRGNTATSIMMMPVFYSTVLPPISFFFLILYVCLQLKEYPTIVVISDSSF